MRKFNQSSARAAMRDFNGKNCAIVAHKPAELEYEIASFGGRSASRFFVDKGSTPP
jgi:hypothetical protein